MRIRGYGCAGRIDSHGEWAGVVKSLGKINQSFISNSAV
jgi:hypothetical protein